MSVQIVKTLSNKSLNWLLEAIVDYSKIHEVSFACWRKPNSATVAIIIDLKGGQPIKPVDLEKSEPGFIISPFSKKEKSWFLRKDILLEWNNQLTKEEYDNSEKTESFLDFMRSHQVAPKKDFELKNNNSVDGLNQYKNLVTKSIESINNGLLNKVVPSRSQEFQFNGEFDASRKFLNLCETYESAFVSMHYTKHTGLWMGATPEVLLETKGQIFKTVALAGTQSFNDYQSLSQVAWTQKEIEEQALVSRYIINCFKKIRLREFKEYGPKTIKAGNLIHLKTIFEVDMAATNFAELGSTMLELLHPTSAVCGMPLENSQQFLQEEETYDRELYSGYLGPINMNDETNLFVNLRCMKIHDSFLTLFAGAGITEDSDPEKEWLETEMKMNTLLNVIRES